MTMKAFLRSTGFLALVGGALLLWPQISEAQRRGGGGGGSRGGFSGGGYRGGFSSGYRGGYSGYRGGYSGYRGGWGGYAGYRGGYNYGNYRPYYGYSGYRPYSYYRPYYSGLGLGIGTGLGYGLYGGYGFGRYRYPTYVATGTYYYNNSPYYAYGQPVQSYQSFYTPETTVTQSSTSDQTVHLLVVAPTENAAVYFEGTRTQQTGHQREFVSPPLAPGRSYTYHVRAVWTDSGGQQHDETRDVPVYAGQWLAVDFNQPPPTPGASGSAPEQAPPALKLRSEAEGRKPIRPVVSDTPTATPRGREVNPTPVPPEENPAPPANPPAANPAPPAPNPPGEVGPTGRVIPSTPAPPAGKNKIPDDLR